MKSRVLTTLAAVIVWSASQSAVAQTIIDTSQPVIDGTVGGLVIGGSSQQKLGQTVTAERVGELRAVYLPIACSSGLLTIEIRDVDSTGKPGTTVLAWRIFTRASAPSIGPVFKRFKIGGLNFNPGDRFAIVIANASGSCGIFNGPLGDTYVMGDAYFDARPNAPGWIPFSQFANSRRDLPFLAEVLTP
jgi:hypothetical protein